MTTMVVVSGDTGVMLYRDIMRALLFGASAVATKVKTCCFARGVPIVDGLAGFWRAVVGV